MRLKIKESTFSIVIICLFLFAIGLAIAYSSNTHTLNCAENGGQLHLVGYSTIHGQGKFLFAKYECALK